MLERLDASIGLLLNKLETLKIADKTVVIFFSDNGGLKRDAMQTPLRGGKAQLYEGGIRVPLIVRWPGIIEVGSLCKTPVTSVDFLPTLCDITGQTTKTPENLDGESILPLLRQDGALKRNTIYWHYPHYHGAGIAPSSAIRKGQYKMIEWLDTSFPETAHRYELYDLENDLGESHNLSREQPQRLSELKENLSKWREKIGAQMLESNPNYDPAKAKKSR
jgi:arylsulfatase A-like enzyme